MVRGGRTLYNNQSIELLKKAAADSIKSGEVESMCLGYYPPDNVQMSNVKKMMFKEKHLNHMLSCTILTKWLFEWSLYHVDTS